MAFLFKAKLLATRSVLRSFVGMNSNSANYTTNVGVHSPQMFFSTDSGTGKDLRETVVNLPPPPKRSPNVFGLFLRDHYKEMPAEMSSKEKFVKAGENWRLLSLEERDRYKKMYADNFIQYRKEMANYLDSLSPDDKENYRKMIRDKSKAKARQRIKSSMRKLNYPKRATSSFIFYLRDGIRKLFPDGKFPQVRSPDHIQAVISLSKNWRTMTPEERKPFDEMSEADRRRFHDELEQWKFELAKPENEVAFAKLERLSNKVEHLNKLTNPSLAHKEKAKRERVRSRSIARALAKKAKAATMASKAKAKASKKKTQTKGVKLAGSKKKKSTKNDAMAEDFD